MFLEHIMMLTSAIHFLCFQAEKGLSKKYAQLDAIANQKTSHIFFI